MSKHKIYLEERPSRDWIGDLSVTIRYKPQERRQAEMLRSEIELLLQQVQP